MTIDYTPNFDSRRVLRTLEQAADFGEVHQQIDATRERIRRVLETAEALPKQTLEQWNTLADKYAPKPLVVLSPDECDHKREYPVIGGIFCFTCRRTRHPESGFESRLVSRLTPRDSGYVHYK
jgi:hypothetical protein